MLFGKICLHICHKEAQSLTNKQRYAGNNRKTYKSEIITIFFPMTKHILQRNRNRNLQPNFVYIKKIQDKEKNKQTKKATSDQNIRGGKDGDPHKVERKKARCQG